MSDDDPADEVIEDAIRSSTVIDPALTCLHIYSWYKAAQSSAALAFLMVLQKSSFVQHDATGSRDLFHLLTVAYPQ